jgi:hypothetical protein
MIKTANASYMSVSKLKSINLSIYREQVYHKEECLLETIVWRAPALELMK